MGISGNKKGMARKGFHSIPRVAIHKSVSPGSSCHRNKKVPKDCHAHAWYPLALLTILNSVCPGSPKKSRNLPVFPEGADISGMSCLSPFPVYRFRIKINYGFILTQYLVSCPLESTIYSISFCFYFHQQNFFQIFFKIFQVFIPYRIFTF